MKPTFFPTAADFRAWLEANHAIARELLVGFYKTGSGRPSLTWPESVDEALCVGWIDGVRKRIDGIRYTIRFSPRKPGSIWSAVNIRKVEALIKERRMRPAGLAAFATRKENRSGIYSYEQRPERFDEPYERRLRKNRAAWAYFQARPASYRRAVIWWVISAKKEETRQKRLETLIELCSRGEPIPQFLQRKPKG